MRPNRTRRILADGGVALGSYAFLRDPASVEAMGRAGLDHAIIDMEHTALDVSHVEAVVRGAETADITPIVRVFENDPKLILRVLEAGAQGVMIPSVRSEKDARAAVAACRYPPEGIRGTCRMSRAAQYGTFGERWPEHTREADREILVVGLVEDAAGAAEIERIVEVMDAVVVGRGDLASAFGVTGDVEHPRVLEVMERALAAGRDTGTPIGTLCYAPSDASRWIAQGFRLLQYGIDVAVLRSAYAGWARQVRDGLAARPADRRPVAP